MNVELLEEHLKKTNNHALYNSIIEENIQSITKRTNDLKEEQNKIEETINTLNVLFQHARLKSFIKLSPISYIPAIVKHTGECNIFLNSSHQFTLTHMQCMEYLKKKCCDLNDTMELYRNQILQMNERLNFEQTLESCDTEDMPSVIKSEKGIAVKRGVLYEIIEEDQSEPTPRGKRVSRLK